MPVSFPQLLDAAERLMQADGSAADLTQALCQQLAMEIAAEFVVLTAWDGTHRILIASVGEFPTSDLNIHAVVVGRVQRQDLPGGQHLAQIAASIAGTATVVLSVGASTVVNDDELLGATVEVAADLYRRRLLEGTVAKDASHRQQLSLVSCLHKSLDTDVVANTIATDGAVITTARTISVARRNGNQWSVVAATGVSHPNDRSDAVRQTLATIKAAESAKKDSSEVDDSTHEFVAKPLNMPPNFETADWAAVFDFSGETQAHKTADGADGLSLLCHHGALALENCDRYTSSTPYSRLQALLRRALKPGGLVSVICVGVAVACLCFLQTDLRIEAYGELVPVDRAFVFAPEDGTIEQVNVKDGSDVTAQTALCVLSNEDLEVQLEKLVGESSATSARLASIAASKGQPGGGTQAGLLSAEQLELEERAKSLSRQILIMERRMSALTLATEMDGRVYGDHLAEMLMNRPVVRGQFLFEVANPDGDWQLDLHVPELDIRHVLNAVEQQNNGALTVRYALETSPEISHLARLKSIGRATEVQGNGQLSTLVVVDVGTENYSTQRPGTGVVAYINCGRRSLGYVWFRKIIEFVQRNTWL